MTRPAHVRQAVRLLLFVSVLTAALGAAACRSAQQPPVATAPPPLRLTFYGTANMNSSGEGENANAAVVRLYGLTSPTNFKDVTPDAFWRDDAAALGEELVSTQQILLYPDQRQELMLDPSDGVQYIGVAADLRRPDPNGWRQVYAVEALRGRTVQVEVGATEVRVIIR